LFRESGGHYVEDIKRVSDEMSVTPGDAAHRLSRLSKGRRFATISPSAVEFTNKTRESRAGAKRLSRYGHHELDEILALPITEVSSATFIFIWGERDAARRGIAGIESVGLHL